MHLFLALGVVAASATGCGVRFKNSLDLSKLISTGPSGSLVTLTSPNGGEVIKGNTVTSISWTTTGLPAGICTAKLEYTLNAGAPVLIAASAPCTTNGSSTYATWTVPNSDQNQVKVIVTITDALGAQATDSSDSNFSLDITAPSFTLAQPVGGEILTAGAVYPITWNSVVEANPNTNPVMIEKSNDGGTSWSTIVASAPDTGTYNWTADSVTSKTYRIRITYTDKVAQTAVRASTSNFWINGSSPSVTVTSPNGGELIAGGPGKTYSITWTNTGLPATGPSTAKIEYSLNNGGAWTTILTGAPNVTNGSSAYTWNPVVTADTSQALIKVTVTDDFNVATADQSNATFTIDSTPPVVTMTGPASNMVVGAGTSATISWTASDAHSVANTNLIEYSNNSGGSWTTLVTNQPLSGSYTWTSPGADPDLKTYRFRVTATDAVAISGSDVTGGGSPGNIFIDNAGPNLTAASFTLNSGAATTVNNTVTIALNVTDTLSNITRFCFKATTAAPTPTDPCWKTAASVGVTPSTSVALTTGHFTFEYVAGSYSVYAWAQDLWGNISILSNSGAGTSSKDLASITYTPPIPAQVLDVVAANTDTPSTPIANSERVAPASSTLYIKWKLSDDKPIPAGSVSLFYTTDETTFNPITTGLNDAINGTCTLSGTATGCYRWNGGSPVGTYYRIRVGVTDSDGVLSFGSGQPLNTGNFAFLAGNTDSGVGGSAQAAYFNFYHPNEIADRKSLVVASDGTMYVKDHVSGILKIDPVTRTASVLIPTTGTSSGDGGLVSAATLKYPSMIAIDYLDRLIVYDYNRIRRLNLNLGSPTIETIIGGGASTADSALATSISLPVVNSSTNQASFGFPTMLMDPLPNGDIIFSSEPQTWLQLTGTTGGRRYRRYDGSTTSVSSTYLTGTGAEGNSSRNLSSAYFMWGGIGFDPLTSNLTGYYGIVSDFIAGGYTNYTGVNFNGTTGLSLGAGPHAPTTSWAYSSDVNFINSQSGKLYQMSRRGDEVRKYNSGLNTWTLLTSGSKGFCPDGTLFSACDIRVDDVFIGANERMYLIDNNMIRVIDNSGKIQTIYGQSYYGSGSGSALSARFGNAGFIERLDNGKLMIADGDSSLLSEMTVGGLITTIAGTGRVANPNVGSLGINASLNYRIYTNVGFYINSATGDAYTQSNNSLLRLNRGTGAWQYFMDGSTGTKCFSDPAADGTSSIIFSGTAGSYTCSDGQVLGGNDNEILIQSTRYNAGVQNDPFYKSYNLSTKIQTHLMGTNTSGFSVPNNTWCADGTSSSSCATMPNGSLILPATWDGAGGQWLMVGGLTNSVKSVVPGGTLTTYETVTGGHQIRAFAVRLGACSNTSYKTQPACVGGGGTWTPASPVKIYYCNAADGKLYRKNVGGGVTPLPFGSSTISCTSETVTWDPARNSAIFGITQNSLSGVAEYYDP